MQNKQPIENLKDRVFNKKGKTLDLFDIYHIFMVSYGYIPFNDFRDMDVLLKNALLKRIIEMRKNK